ncbi:hypothetical protein KM043_000429 [Ampulex compressa]|nr:hypothetical protein KM043_000429 [Ampulex compressa]
MAVKGLVAAFVEFLTQQLEEGDITADSRESLEVAIQCLESAYNVQASDTPANFNLYKVYKSALENTRPNAPTEATPEAKAEAEKLKNEGNDLLTACRYHEAVTNYTKAIQLDGRNAAYYHNRAVAHYRLGNYHKSIGDCQSALSIDPSYGKAYGRLGLAYIDLGRNKEARDCYLKALELEPDNESYRNNLRIVEEKLAQQGVNQAATGAGSGAFAGVELSSLLTNPVLMNMARQMLSDPTMQNMVSGLMTGNVEQGGHMDTFIEVGQQLAQQMQNANPELIESLRRQMGGNPNDPDPPQNN